MKLDLASALPLVALPLLASSASAQLVHRYSFDGTGTTLVDSVGTANGMLKGGATLTGQGSLDFDGVDDYVEFPSALISSFPDVTLEVWATWDGPATSNWQRIFDFGDSSAGPGIQGAGLTYFVLTPRDSGMNVQAVAYRAGAVSSTKVYGSVSAPVGGLVHYVVIYEGATQSISLYVDGVFEDTVAMPNPLSALNDVNCWLGQSQFSNDPNFDGAIHEFRIYSAALDAALIFANSLAGPNGEDLGQAICSPAVANSSGMPARMLLLGNDDASAAPYQVVMLARDMPSNQFGYFLGGKVQGFLPMAGGSQGTLCLGLPLGRFISSLQSSGPLGSFAHEANVSAMPLTPAVPVLAGDSWTFQAWYRDVNPNSTSNFTDAVQVMFL